MNLISPCEIALVVKLNFVVGGPYNIIHKFLYSFNFIKPWQELI